jgi:predicted TIM-barrel fold metal-dependent hydrolase
MPHETAIAMASMVFGGVFEKYPTLRVCFAHGGGCFPGLIGRLSHGFNARPDLNQTRCQTDPYKFLQSVYIDSLVHDSDMLRYVVSKFGSERVIMGSDYPFPLGEMDYPGRLIEETYTPSTEPLPTPPGHTASPHLGAREVCKPADEAAAARMVRDRENMLWRNAARFLKLPIPIEPESAAEK